MSARCQAPKFLLTGHGCFLIFFPWLQQSYLRALFVSLTFSIILLCDLVRSIKSAWTTRWVAGCSATQGLCLLLFTCLIAPPICQLRFMTMFQGHDHVPRGWSCWEFSLQKSEVVACKYILDFINISSIFQKENFILTIFQGLRYI